MQNVLYTNYIYTYMGAKARSESISFMFGAKIHCGQGNIAPYLKSRTYYHKHFGLYILSRQLKKLYFDFDNFYKKV